MPFPLAGNGVRWTPPNIGHMAHARGRAAHSPICGCPIWDLPFVPAQYDGEFRGRFLGPRDFSLPLAG
eukprot:4541850-Prymnesium_polylepis.1